MPAATKTYGPGWAVSSASSGYAAIFSNYVLFACIPISLFYYKIVCKPLIVNRKDHMHFIQFIVIASYDFYISKAVNCDP